MPDRIGAFSLEDVVGALRSAAVDCGLSLEPSRYTLAGDALLPEPVLSSDPALAERIRAFHGALVTVELPFRAKVILVKTNVRALGLDQGGATPKSLKVRLNPVLRGQSAFRDIRARRLARTLLAGTGVSVPLVLDYDRRAVRWLMEEEVAGAPPNFRQYIGVLLGLKKFLARTARPRPVFGSQRSRDITTPAFAEIQRLGFKPPVDKASSWLVAFAHGDLTVDNVLLDQGGKPWLIDWEHAAIEPVCLDVSRVCCAFPDAIPAAIELLKALDPRRRVLSPEIQLAVGAAVWSAAARKRRNQDVAQQIRMHHHSAPVAAQVVDATLHRLEGVVRHLLLAVGPAASRFARRG